MALQALWDVSNQFNNKNGSILTNGKVFVYFQGRTALATTYNDEDGTVVNSNPILLDNNGRATCYADPIYSYTVVVCDFYGKELFSYDITLHDAISTAEDVVVIGSDGTVLVDRTQLPNGVQYDLSVNTDIIATKEDVSDLENEINDKLDDKKDLQEEKTFTGSQTKTITKVEQDEQGVIKVTYEDIDLPPEVPNVEITSPNGTIDVQSSTDVQTNTKTFTIDINKTTLDFFDGYNGKSHYEDRNPNEHDTPIACYVDQWSEYKYQGDFITNDWQANNNINFVLKPGLYLITASIRYDMHNEWSVPSNPNPSKSNNDEYIRIATGAYNGLENGTRYKDWTHEYQLGENTIQMTFVRNVMNDSSYNYMNNNNYLYFDPYLPFGVNYLQLAHLQIVKLDSVVGGSGGGSTYTAGDGIDITDNEISVKYDNADVQDQDRNLDFGDTFGIADSFLTTGENGELVNEVTWQDVTLPTIKAGDGISFSKTGTETTISMDSDVSDVVDTVEKLKKDLDTQITPNFDMPNISQVYDFADPTNWITANGACMLYQAFTIPINHEVRTLTDDADTPTLFGIYAQQSFGHKIMLALYEYQYAEAGEEHGSSTYVGDTGPVSVLQGVNEYPLKNRNPSITELRSDRVYYAALYLPSTAFVNGLYLAGCPSYGNQSVPAEPRLSCATENITWENQELDMTDPTTTLNHYQVIEIPGKDPYYQYYIGPWVGGYNERWSSPRFYMQIRNGEFNEPVIPTEPFTDLGETKLPRGGILASNLPNFSSSSANSGFRDVTPLTNVTITAFEWIDNSATAHGWEAGNCVYSSDYSTNLSGVSNSVVDLGEVFHDESYTAYRHRITFTTPITLTANVTYRFLCSTWASSSEWIWSWADPTNVFDASNNGWYVDWSSNVSRYSHIAGQYLKLYDNNNNHWVI